MLMNYYIGTDRQTESNAYEPTMQYAQVGSKIDVFWENFEHECKWQ